MTSFINSWFSSNKDSEETPTQSVPTNAFNAPNFGPSVDNYQHMYPQSGLNSNMNRDGNQHPPPNFYRQSNIKDAGALSGPRGYPQATRPGQNMYPEIQPHLAAAARHPVSQPQPESDPWNWSLDGAQENTVQQQPHSAAQNRTFFTPHSDTQNLQQSGTNDTRFNQPPLQPNPSHGQSQFYAPSKVDPHVHPISYNQQNSGAYYNSPSGHYGMPSAQMPPTVSGSNVVSPPTAHASQEAYPPKYYNQSYSSGPPQHGYELTQGHITAGPVMQPTGAVPFTPPVAEISEADSAAYDDWNRAWTDSASPQPDVVQGEAEQPSPYNDHQAPNTNPPFVPQVEGKVPQVWSQPTPENVLQHKATVDQTELNPNAPSYYPKEEPRSFEQNHWGYSGYTPHQNVDAAPPENVANQTTETCQPSTERNEPFQRETQAFDQQSWDYQRGYEPLQASNVIQQDVHPGEVLRNEEMPNNGNNQVESPAVKQMLVGSSHENSPRPNVDVVQQELDRDGPPINDQSSQDIVHAHEVAQEYMQPVQQTAQSNNQTESPNNFLAKTTDSLPLRSQGYEQQTWGYSEQHVQQNINLTQMGIVSTSLNTTAESATQNYDTQSWGYPQTAVHQNINIIQTEVRQETTGDVAHVRSAPEEEESQDFGSVVSASSIMYGNDDGYNKLGETDNFAYLSSGTTGNKGLAAQWSTESLHSQSSGELRDDENLQHSLSTVNSMCDQIEDLHLTSTTSNEGVRPDLLAASETLSSSSSGVNVGRRYNVAGRQDNAFGSFGHGNDLDNLETLPENQERPNSIGEQLSAQRIPVGQESSPRQWPSNFPSQPDNQELAGRCNPDRNQYLETGQLPDDELGMERMVPGAGNEGEPLQNQRMVPGSRNEEEARNQRMVPGARNEEEPLRNQRMVPGAGNEREPPPGLRRMVPGESSSPETRGLSSQQSGTRLLNGDGEETAPPPRTQPDSAVVATSTERSATIGSDTVDTFVQPAPPPTPPSNSSRREQPKKRRDERRRKEADSTDDDRPRRDKPDRERDRDRERERDRERDRDRDRNKPTRKTSRHEREDSDSRRSQESLRNKDARRRRDRERDRDEEPASGSDTGSERKRRYDRDRYKKERSPDTRGYRDDRRGPRRPYSTKERARDEHDYYSSKDRSRDEYKSRRSEHRETGSEYSDYERREVEHSRTHFRHGRDGKSKYRGDRDPRYANSYRGGEDDWRYAPGQRHPQYYDRYDHNGYHRPESREQHMDQRMYFQYMTEEELMSKLAYYAAAPISNESVDYFNAVRGLPWSTKAHHNWFYYKFTPWLKMQETSNSYRDDGRGSVHSGRSSENKHFQDITSGVRSSTPQRLTPTLYSTAHIRGILSAQGSLIKVAPHYPLDGQPATVFLSPMQGHTFDKPIRDQMKIFPGPLIRGKTHKQTLISFCNQKIANLQQKDLDDDHILIWQLLILLIKQNGMVVGTDISELLLGNEQTTAPSPSPSSESRRSSDSASESAHYSSVAKFNVKSEEELTKTFRNFLLYGNDNEALEWAMSNNLWGHAFFLGSKMDNRTNAKVMARFANGLPYNDPLQTFYQLKSGRQPAAVTGCVDEKWGNWRPHLAMMMANSGSSELDYKSLMTLGDSLGSRGSLYASHFIYIMAQVEFMPYSQRGSAKLVLIGSSHAKSYSEFATNEAIQLTEIYEYASKLREGNEAFCIPSFQWFKLVYAERLVEAGFQLEALLYLEQIAGHVQHQPHLYDTGFISRVHRLGDRLKYADPLLKDALASDHEQLVWLSMLDDLVRSRAGEQVGSYQPSYPTQPYRQESLDSNYNQPTLNQQQPYSHDTYADPSEPQSLSYAPADADSTFDKTATYAPSYDKAAAEPRPEEQSYQYQSSQAAPTDALDSSAAPNYTEHWQPNQQWQAPEQSESAGGYDLHQSNVSGQTNTQEQNKMYDPSAHQMYQPNQWNDVDNSRADNEDEPPEPADPMPPPPQISLPNSYSPRERQNSESNGKVVSATSGAGSAAKPPKPTDDKSKSNQGWFGGIFHKLSLKPKNQMILPEDKNPTIVWDPVKKRWIDTEADGDEVAGSFAPPPKASEMAGFNSMVSNHNSVGASPMQPQAQNPNMNPNANENLNPNPIMQGSAPMTQAAVSSMPPPASASLNGYKPNRKGKNFRSNYVDIFKGTGSLTPTPAAPPGLFDIAPQSNVKIFTPYGAGGNNVPTNDSSAGAYNSPGQGDTQQMSRWSSASSLSREVQSYTMRGLRHTAKTPQPSSGSTQMYAHQGYTQPNTTLGYNRI